MQYPEKESSTVEFKETFPKNNQIVKTVVGFCNQKGGKIIIGITDEGMIKGLSNQEIEFALENFDKKIFESTSPTIIPQIYTQTIHDKIVLIIEVSSGMNKPYFIKNEGLEKGTYIRLGRTTARATSDTIKELQWSSQGRSFDTMPVYNAQLEDLDSSKIMQFLASRKGSERSPISYHDALKAYNIVTYEHTHAYPTVAGILLFGKEPERFFSEAFIICSVFKGIEGREIIATRDCWGTLFDQVKRAEGFILSQLNRSYAFDGLQRKEQYEIPEIAVREALVNAIVHRNYHINGPIKIALFDNRLEIFSPGGFPGELHEKNLLMGLTYIRNGVLAKVFREAGYSEKLGTGFRIIFSSYTERNLRTPSIIEGENFVRCILPRKELEKQYNAQKGSVENLILSLFETAQSLSIGEITGLLDLPRATVGRKLVALVKKGDLTKRGSGKATRYNLPE